MNNAQITGRQMKRLQTLWGLFARQAHLDVKDREARIGWVAGAVGRQIVSFKELSSKEAEMAIDAVQKHLPPELLKRAARPSRRTAHAYGTAGRKSAHKTSQVRMVDGPTLELLSKLKARLGWNQEKFDAFMRSPRCPVKSGAVRTLDEANKIIWVLKGFLRRQRTSGLASTNEDEKPEEPKERADGHQPSANHF